MNVFWNFFLLFFPVFAGDFKSFIIVSENTPSDLVSEFSILSNSSVPAPVLRFSPSLLPAFRKSHPHLIFDFTYSLQYQVSLRAFAIKNRVLLFSSREPMDSYSEWVFYLHPPPSAEAQAIRSFLKYLNWTDFHLLTSESSRSRAMFSSLSPSTYQLLSNSADQEVFDLYASRIVKASGNWKVVVLSEDKGAGKLIWGMEKTRIWKERSGFVVSSKGWRGSKKLGAIGIVEEGLEDTQSEAEHEYQSILRVIKILKELTEDLKGSFISNEILAKKLREKSSENIVSETFSIVNFKGDSRIIGKIEKGRVETWEEILFPGNVTYMNNSPPKVLISANTGVVLNDQSVTYGVFLVSLGLQPMVSLVNKDASILPNFELELHETDCGYVVFEYDYASSCMEKHWDNIGAAHLASSMPAVLIPYLDLFEESKIEVPHITLGYSDPKLFDKNLYPEVLVTLPNPLHFYIILPYIIRSFQWKNIIVISDDGFDPYNFSIFADSSETLSISILNPKDLMFIPYLKTETYFKDVKDIIQFIYDSKCRIIVFFTLNTSHRHFIEALYDFGYRKGELVFILPDLISRILEESEEFEFDREKVSELASGSLAFTMDQFVGEYGQGLEKQIASMVDPFPTTYACFRIDALMLAVHTIDLMIRAGRDYEDFQDLMYFMRGIRFTGCTGKVSIDSGGNGLSDIVYAIYNFYQKEGQEHEVNAGSYILGITVPLKVSKSIVWPDGTTTIPKDLIEETKCGFAYALVKKNKSSQELSVLITSGLFLAILIVTGLVWKQFESPKIEFLEEKREMMFEDGVMLYFPLIETAQFLSLGPDFYKANFMLAFVCSLLSLDLNRIIDFNFDEFWTILAVVAGVSSLWCFSLFFTLKFPTNCLPYFVKDFFEVVGLTLIQVFSGAGFVGINYVLFRIFKCPKGIGEDLLRSFLENDCKTFCWEGAHLYFLVMICVVIVIFNFFVISSRPIYEMAMDHVSVKVFPLYAFVKGIFQLILVILNLHLKHEYPEIFSGAYCTLFIGWLLFLFKVDCYNYARLNSWVRVFGSGVCTHQVLMVGYTLLNIPDLAVLILQVAIIVACTGIGFYFQVKKFPSMLFKRKGRNFEKLLVFAFSGRMRAEDLTQHQLDYVDNSRNYEIR